MNSKDQIATYLNSDSYSLDRQYVTQFGLIRNWATERNLIEGASPEKQMLKMVEELGELSKAIGKQDMPEIIDGLGDCIVVLTILAAQHGLKIEYCIASAYNEIKDRKGRMVNGLFQKDAV